MEFKPEKVRNRTRPKIKWMVWEMTQLVDGGWPIRIRVIEECLEGSQGSNSALVSKMIMVKPSTVS
jgi:hypothetical protein